VPIFRRKIRIASDRFSKCPRHLRLYVTQVSGSRDSIIIIVTDINIRLESEIRLEQTDPSAENDIIVNVRVTLLSGTFFFFAPHYS